MALSRSVETFRAVLPAPSLANTNASIRSCSRPPESFPRALFSRKTRHQGAVSPDQFPVMEATSTFQRRTITRLICLGFRRSPLSFFRHASCHILGQLPRDHDAGIRCLSRPPPGPPATKFLLENPVARRLQAGGNTNRKEEVNERQVGSPSDRVVPAIRPDTTCHCSGGWCPACPACIRLMGLG
jgi:hypothetical protein